MHRFGHPHITVPLDVFHGFQQAVRDARLEPPLKYDRDEAKVFETRQGKISGLWCYFGILCGGDILFYHTRHHYIEASNRRA